MIVTIKKYNISEVCGRVVFNVNLVEALNIKMKYKLQKNSKEFIFFPIHFT